MYIIDDDEGAREGLANLLASEGMASASYASPQEFLRAWSPTDSGCVILDIRFPDESGLDFQLQMNERGIALPVILVTGFADIESSVRGLKAGAIDFLLKPYDDGHLLSAIADAFEQDASRVRRERDQANLVDRFATLTLREQQVFSLVVRGLMNKQVAAAMNLSEITVKVHRGSMMRKMDLRTLADLVRASERLIEMRLLADVSLNSTRRSR
ncbi:response regulator [Tardiphaga sp. P9-11]|uniref:response regulator transcription factor n=1 Tax=Tardiphaga sp. P9-11 TaxID=2024614 RepID=UPI001FEDB00D|nr:response regulator [Tardiphaga sp. P9-11]